MRLLRLGCLVLRGSADGADDPLDGGAVKRV